MHFMRRWGNYRAIADRLAENYATNLQTFSDNDVLTRLLKGSLLKKREF